ncbi:circularly permuted type 2 ATP-grasp protein [Pseudoflavitalea sp. X16]|uniref:circularly permuted type 2 ATP-grasp protein n=1 Tax=Paraflavitalea devenefica TaxID=2716334 RepID=UPI0014204448|nr:circularly permuted type 2 ATP-grasp protein [Paraflavitalea devenefica]NII29534.1 circularly permuted type 2 ATP-grasp protein [Paraflavitalea devenefica]
MPGQTSVHEFLQQYIPASNSYNELYTEQGKVRADWERFFLSLQGLGHQEIQNRTNDIVRLLKENGVAYNIYNDPSGETRPWELDPIPQLIPASEWAVINKGLVQRATLFNLLLKDIYGPQTLIKEGIIPQELIYMHPGFLRSCMNINLPAQQYLVLYAADMGRGADGRLWIISDRTQAPSGYGYALENRFAMSGVLPELFSNLQVRRLSPFFDTLQQALNSIAPSKNESPRIVILTPGPENETYFEHSYLSGYLGITLVQGNDLMVKDNFLWLKTIEGLEKVDVILRRMDDAYCDPLELKSDSLLGVPGLLQVVRKGNVAIANPLGSSIIENAGLVPFLHQAARHLVGEELIIPSIATWWCGQPKEMQYVIDNLQHLVIRRIFRRTAGTRSAIDGASLSKEDAAGLIREIKANPYLYTGQEKINFSSTPSWGGGKIEPGHSLIRSFLVKKEDGFMAMPGGLTRTSNAENSFIISNQTGGVSKDTWVLSAGEDHVQPIKLQLQTSSTYNLLQKESLPSHTAENLFWAGRHTERLINNARLVRTVMQFLMQHQSSQLPATGITKKLLLEALTHCTYSYPGFLAGDSIEQYEDLINHPWEEFSKNLYDENKNGGLSQNLLLFKKSVYNVRSFLSTDTWRVVEQIAETWQKAKNRSQHDPMSMVNDLDNLNTSMFAFLGMNRESARREQEWTILDLGRKFEQSLFIIRLLQQVLDKKQEAQTEYELLEAMLTATQSMTTYRYTFRDHLQLPLVLELMMLDMNYSKSLAYLIDKIRQHVAALPKQGKAQTLSEPERLMLEAHTLLHLSNGLALCKFENNGQEYLNLKELLGRLNELLLEANTVISKTYFKHTLSQQQLFVKRLL